MNKLFLITIIAVTLFTSCSQPDKMAFYKQDSTLSKYPDAWQTLLLLPEEYFPKGTLKHFVHPPFMSEYQKSNPGFINLSLFKKQHPKHELSTLLLWYSASFFYQNAITHYMIMEFDSDHKAKAYVKRLQSNGTQKLNKILRYKSILFSFTLRDFDNNILDKKSHIKTTNWIEKTLTRITENL